MKKGDFVRVHVRHGQAFKKSYKSQWLKLIYIIISRSKPTNPLLQPAYSIKDVVDNTKISNKFSREKLSPPEIWGDQHPNRPDFFNGAIFDRETYLQNIQQQKKAANTRLYISQQPVLFIHSFIIIIQKSI